MPRHHAFWLKGFTASACAAGAAISLAMPAAAQTETTQSPIGQAAKIAEVLGATHYLQLTCATSEQQVWRARMVRLMELEAEQSGPRRERLVRAFNNGFRAEQRRHGGCADAEADRRRLAGEGRKAAEALRALYVD